MKKILTLTAVSVFALAVASNVRAEEAAKVEAAAEAPKADVAKKAHNHAKKARKGHHTHAGHHNEHHDLKAQVEALTKRLGELEAKDKMDLTEKEGVTKTNGLKVVLSGQVNRAVLWQNDGSHANVVHVDPSDETSSRVRIAASAKVSESETAGANIEADIRSNRAEWTDVKSANDTNSSFAKRVIEAYYKNDRWGGVTLGHGFMAGARVTRDTDMSATGAVAMGDTVGQIGGGTWFTQKNLASIPVAANKAVNAAGAPLDIKAVFNGVETGRDDRFQIETPTFWGTKLEASHAYTGRNDKWDVALKHACELAGTKLAVQIAYLRNLANRNGGLQNVNQTGVDSAKYNQWSGSIGALFPVGISVMFATTQRDWKVTNAPKGNIYFGKLGYQQKFFEAGLTAMAVDYGRFKNMILNRGNNVANGANTATAATDTIANIKNSIVGKTYGATLVQHFDRIGTEAYVTARIYQLDAKLLGLANNVQPSTYRDITTVMTGMRVTF